MKLRALLAGECPESGRYDFGLITLQGFKVEIQIDLMITTKTLQGEYSINLAEPGEQFFTGSARTQCARAWAQTLSHAQSVLGAFRRWPCHALRHDGW